MKRFIFLLLLVYSVSFAQDGKVLKTHLFLGTWYKTTAEGELVEKWKVVSDSEFTGVSFLVSGKDTIAGEKISLRYINGVLTYCPTVFDQNAGKEILFPLKETDSTGKIFIFENLKHDYPQRIIYDFTGYKKLTAKIEDSAGTKSAKFIFSREYNPFESYELNGRIIKKPLVNKVGRESDTVFDYYFEIEGECYFIKTANGDVNLDKINEYIGERKRMRVVFMNGLWDTDDVDVQSRMGTYVIPLGIIE